MKPIFSSKLFIDCKPNRTSSERGGEPSTVEFPSRHLDLLSRIDRGELHCRKKRGWGTGSNRWRPVTTGEGVAGFSLHLRQPPWPYFELRRLSRYTISSNGSSVPRFIPNLYNYCTQVDRQARQHLNALYWTLFFFCLFSIFVYLRPRFANILTEMCRGGISVTRTVFAFSYRDTAFWTLLVPLAVKVRFQRYALDNFVPSFNHVDRRQPSYSRTVIAAIPSFMCTLIRILSHGTPSSGSSMAVVRLTIS